MDKFYLLFGKICFWVFVPGLGLAAILYVWVNFLDFCDYLNRKFLFRFYWRYYILGKVAPTDKIRETFKIKYFYTHKHLRKQAFLYRLRNIRNARNS